MRWIRIHSHFDIWAAVGPAPTFCITSDDDGEAYIEIAKRPELLIRPHSEPGDYWNVFFSKNGSNDGSVTAAAITLTGGRAVYTLPKKVWQGMSTVAQELHESKQRLYYRVWARPRGATKGGYLSHTDTDIQNGSVPFIQVLPLCGDLQTSTPVNDVEAVAHLDVFDRTMLAVIRLLGTANAEYKALQRLLAHDTYRSQDSSTRARVLALFVKAGGNGRQVIKRLLDLQVPVGCRPDGSYMTKPALYYRDERNEGTTLDHLLALWKIQLDTRIPISLSAVIYEVILELVDPPGRLNQGYAGTCAATSIQCYVAWRNPAEYARWCRYILDRQQTHRVQLAKNGVYMKANPEAFDVATWINGWKSENPGKTPPVSWVNMVGRTYSERGIQAAIMDFANFRYRYDPEKDAYYKWIIRVEKAGLWEFEISRAIEAIFNEPWKFDFGGGSVSSAPNAAAAQNLISHLKTGLPVIITMSWDNGAHAVLGLRVENQRVIFRNPQYRGAFPPSGHSTGTNLTKPTRRIHNVKRAEESMDLAGLQAAICGFCYESVTASDRGYTAAEIPASLKGSVTPTAT
jgi:hypothetical protein